MTSPSDSYERDGQSTAVLWRPISSAPRSYHPPLSTVNHHAPPILLYLPLRRAVVGVWAKTKGAPGGRWEWHGTNKPLEEEPIYWAPLPYDPNELDYEERTGVPAPRDHIGKLGA